jgi:hypothetical protein
MSALTPCIIPRGLLPSPASTAPRTNSPRMTRCQRTCGDRGGVGPGCTSINIRLTNLHVSRPANKADASASLREFNSVSYFLAIRPSCALRRSGARLTLTGTVRCGSEDASTGVGCPDQRRQWCDYVCQGSANGTHTVSPTQLTAMWATECPLQCRFHRAQLWRLAFRTFL